MNHWLECIDLAWNILGARRFTFVQMKSLESQMAMPYGDMVLYSKNL